MTTTNQKDKAKISTISWITASIGFLLVLSSIIFLLIKGFSEAKKTPKIDVKVLSVEKEKKKYLVMIEVNNSGSTAAALVIEGELMDGTASKEKATVTLTYVPEGSFRKAGIYFNNNPKDYEMILIPKSFEVP